MLFCAVKRNLRHLFVVGLFSAVVIAHPNPANAGISIHGGTPESRAQILAEVDARWRSEITRNTELAITIGASALAEFCSTNKQTPVLATYLYRSRYLEIQEDCAQPVAAILADTALRADQLDEQAADDARRAAEEALKGATAKEDLVHAQEQLVEAAARYRAAQRLKGKRR